MLSLHTVDIVMIVATLLGTALVGAQAVKAANTDREATFHVHDFGAVGDGSHDDRPAILAVFDAAKQCPAQATVVFDRKRYFLGDNPEAWHAFVLQDRSNLVVNGNGATLVCADGNLAFHFNGGTNITVRGLTLDTAAPCMTQGEVVSVDGRGFMDVALMQGYPVPPDEAFLKANNHRAWGGGGRHMIVFENGGRARNTTMANDHLYIESIRKISDGVYRFHVKERYLSAFAGVEVGNWITYGHNRASLPAPVVAAKDTSASIYAQIAADRVQNLTLEDITIYGSLNGGIRVSDMPGDVMLRNIGIVRKPGTRNLLSTCSDALHLMNIRGHLIVEGCTVEAPGDDCLNIGTLMERVVERCASNPKQVTLRTTDNRYYYYTIQTGDRLQFINMQTDQILGTSAVTDVSFQRRNREHRVALDREIAGLDSEHVRVMNLEQMSRSTLLRDNTLKPFMRNAALVRAQNMTLSGNRFDCSAGGVHGVSTRHSMGENARLRNLRILDNTFICPANLSMLISSPFRIVDGSNDAQGVRIAGNTFRTRRAPAVRIDGVNGLAWHGNRFGNGADMIVSSCHISLSNTSMNDDTRAENP